MGLCPIVMIHGRAALFSALLASYIRRKKRNWKQHIHNKWNEKHVRLIYIYLQVFLQPLILLKEKLQAKFKIEINLSGERDDVGWAQVPAGDTHC